MRLSARQLKELSENNLYFLSHTIKIVSRTAIAHQKSLRSLVRDSVLRAAR